ncbi:hypothetical protein E2562_007123 [Oryza meyeriana var. granulata]|uniref:CCHC-type domain-containing protein n=1 Tax=Oryza meyeriana var. granulata TaxID=110450 RepID=A0A6G1F547_9ORYZ|nr:hypothetical protein E2562_007123 [Oryza meyeriana var. granulata]
MATSGKSDTRAPHFDGTDYDYWQSRMKAYLKGKGMNLWRITQNSTYVIPAEDPTDPAAVALLEANNRVEAIVEFAGYETLTTDELFSKLKSKEIDVLSKRKLKNPTGTSSTDVPMALVSGNDELEALDDDQLVLLSNKFKRVYENRRNRRRSEGCFSCGERGHFAVDCPNKIRTFEQGNNSRRQEQSREKKKKKGDRRMKKNGQKYTDKQIKKAAHVLFSSLGDFVSDASSNSNDSDSEDELPNKKTDGLCFLADIKGGMCTMALDDDEAFDRSDNSSDNESGAPVDEKNPPLAKYTGPPPKKEGSGVTPKGLLVEPSRSAPKKQVWVPKPKHFKVMQNAKPTASSSDRFAMAKPNLAASGSKAMAFFASAHKRYHCDFCDRDGHLYEFCFRRKRAERPWY